MRKQTSAAVGARESVSNASINVCTLYPPCMVPNSFTAFFASIRGLFVLPLTMAVRKSALTYAASSTPGGTRCVKRFSRKSSSPLGGFSSSFTRSEHCAALMGFGTTPMAARSATCFS